MPNTELIPGIFWYPTNLGDNREVDTHLWFGLDQFSGLAVERGALEEEAVHVDALGRRLVDLLVREAGHRVLHDHRVERPAAVCPRDLLPGGVSVRSLGSCFVTHGNTITSDITRHPWHYTETRHDEITNHKAE